MSSHDRVLEVLDRTKPEAYVEEDDFDYSTLPEPRDPLDHKWDTAWHEAGHAIALSLYGESWVATVVPDDWSLGHVAPDNPRAFDDPELAAFVCWAGSYAEARGSLWEDHYFYEHDEDWPELSEDVEEVWANSGSDAEYVRMIGHEVAPERWSRSLDLAWEHIRELALKLVLEDTVG